ncbi:MAG: coenzyme F420-0:L-glutamate ligase [Candidatus Kaiserbacteria bacterium]|nr:coenzyme F420-0:L-glutamate ligase [Candidatus Kaiserbacteria bacterium]MCB9816389.1 coenzyme F420-0:L-glutamate ligase [Candidatus Nomurabacteria bacterium]
MQIIGIKTRVLQPPKDDLFSVLDESLTDVQEGDVVCVSSKVVAINEGRCVAKEVFDKEAHIAAEAQVMIPRPYWHAPLTITNNVFVSSAGVDQSNSDGYYTLLPQDPFVSAEAVYTYLKKRFNLKNIGVIITDSRSEPCRFGAVGAAIGFWGVSPLHDHIGREDLFGRKIRVERSNIVDGIAAAAVVVMGEVDECTPVAIVRAVPDLRFAEGNQRDQLFCPFAEDTFRVLYEDFLT